MKNLVFTLLGMFLLAACANYTAFQKPEPVSETSDVAQITDSVEYDLIIMDIGFESWFATRNMPATARSNQYYKHWNYQYVIQWNQLHMQGHPYFENYIDFDPHEDYGFDVNYKLYHYFKFVEEKTGKSLVRR
jgi:hypothetical protein